MALNFRNDHIIKGFRAMGVGQDVVGNLGCGH